MSLKKYSPQKRIYPRDELRLEKYLNGNVEVPGGYDVNLSVGFKVSYRVENPLD